METRCLTGSLRCFGCSRCLPDECDRPVVVTGLATRVAPVVQHRHRLLASSAAVTILHDVYPVPASRAGVATRRGAAGATRHPAAVEAAAHRAAAALGSRRRGRQGSTRRGRKRRVDADRDDGALGRERGSGGWRQHVGRQRCVGRGRRFGWSHVEEHVFRELLLEGAPAADLHSAALAGRDGRAVGQRRGGVPAVPADIEGAGLGPVLEASRLQSAFDVAGVEPAAVDRAPGRGVTHEGDQARAVGSSCGVSARDVGRSRQLLHERQQRCGSDSKHDDGQ